MKSCVTISLVEEARGGPFVFWDGVADGCRQAAELGFDAVEIFPPSAAAIEATEVRSVLQQHGLRLAAVGTGAGWVKHGFSLTDPNQGKRNEARDFVRSIIDCAGPFGASAIIGSMQGRHGNGSDKQSALGWLGDAIAQLGDHARQYEVPLLYEPLNRYETNLCNTLQDGVDLLRSSGATNVKLLADLFHMNIEESDLPGALSAAGDWVGHVHFVDSNRQAAGAGHIQFEPIIETLKSLRFSGYLSAEAFAIPDSRMAAQLTIEAYRKFTA